MALSTMKNTAIRNQHPLMRRSSLPIALMAAVLAPSAFLSRLATAFSTQTYGISSPSPIAKAAVPIRFETKSCSPPRFDAFGELLVGKWAIEDASTKTSKEALVADVEEVMRSCGGAVQGIREPSSNEQESSTYLNRANDGFVFFDDGCYTLGPLAMPQNSNAEESYLSCLVLPEKDPEGRTQRLLLDGNEEKLFATVRTKQRFGDALEKKPEEGQEEEEEPTGAVCTLEEITRIIRCKMPGEQPWMLQRAKWETLLPSDVSNDDSLQDTFSSDATNDNSSSSSKEPLFWVTSDPLQDFYERLGTTASNMGDSGEDGIVVQSGVACPSSKTLRLLARQYRTRAGVPELCGILRVEGKVRFDDC